MKNIPEKIWLNIGEEVPNYADFHDLSEVTWSENKVFDNDVEYVRKSEWISVDDRLPDECQDVIIMAHCESTYGERFILCENLRYEQNRFFGDSFKLRESVDRGIKLRISHWFPIPTLNTENSK